MSSIADGRATSKRALSPDPSPVHERKSKILKLDLQQENVSNDLSNKENSPRNSIESGRKDEFRSKENPDEIIMVKHYLATHHRERDEDDDVNGADEQRDHSSSQHPWHRSHPFWNHLIQKTFDETYQCHSNFLDAHPAISTKMRSVLCDWLIEVCEVYHLHRETYHLAIAYVDQYLSNTSQLAKTKLQLLGITALFIAAKIEEIYPPRISEFAYVTDKAYHESDILEMELEIMRALNWHINPITAISWLLIYLQVEYDLQRVNSNSISSGSDPDRSSKKRRVMILPNEKEFLRTSILSNIHRSSMFLQTFSLAVRLLDLCSLDAEYSQYPKNVLAATALLACRSDWPVEQISSLNDDDLYVCSEWMKPFFDVLYFGQNLLSLPLPASRPAPSIPLDEIYSIQIHNISLDLLENVYKKRPKFVPPSLTNRPFRNLVNRLSWLPTPPTSLEKQQHETIVTEEETIEISEVISVQ